ncbi:hypothetical protein [Streptomyces sp. BP-8]|uniref:hypothetical protein n=1 Tax=Streptomyces sirii TaxID=3127701 RepID=UPI00388FFA14
MPSTALRDRPAWKALAGHHSEIAGRHLRELFAADPGRGERMAAEATGLYLDYSKNRITDEVDLIGFGNSPNPLGSHHDVLSSNVFAQAQALGFGKTEDEVRAEGTAQDVAPHRVMEGNRPTNVLLAEVLTPYRLGTLVALYEHSVFTQGTIWGIDSFDQWGVELGKVLAVAIIPELEGATEPELGHDSSTNALIRHYRTLKD